MTGRGGEAGDLAATRVGIGLIRRGDAFLVRQRPSGAPLAGLWEFPGGKCEPGESPAEAAARECREELGFEVALGPLRSVVTHRYAHGAVELYYYDGSPASGCAEPLPESGFRWVRAADLAGLPFPDANGPIVLELVREFSPQRGPAPG